MNHFKNIKGKETVEGDISSDKNRVQESRTW